MRNRPVPILSVLGDTKRQARFLEAVLVNPNVPKNIKKAVSIAGTGGQKALDLAFNSVANGVSTATVSDGASGSLTCNASLAYDSSDTIDYSCTFVFFTSHQPRQCVKIINQFPHVGW